MHIGGAQVRNLDDLVSVMQRHLLKWDDAHDRRATFLRVYITMTKSVNAHLHDGYFLDPPWIERVAVRFASYYFDALERFEGGERAPPPGPWLLPTPGSARASYSKISYWE